MVTRWVLVAMSLNNMEAFKGFNKQGGANNNWHSSVGIVTSAVEKLERMGDRCQAPKFLSYLLYIFLEWWSGKTDCTLDENRVYY